MLQPDSRYRYLGTTTDPVAHLIAFKQVPGAGTISREYWTYPFLNRVLYDQGLIGIDPASYQIIRMYTELLAPRPEVGLEAINSEIEFEQVSFKNGSLALWLPREVNVFIRRGNVNYRNQHRYSDYKMFTVDSY